MTTCQKKLDIILDYNKQKLRENVIYKLKKFINK